MLIAHVVANPDRTHCDACDNAPPQMVVVQGKHNDETYPGLWLCRVCFRQLRRLTLPSTPLAAGDV